MEQEKDNQASETVQPVEHDLFSMTAPEEPRSADAEPAGETAAPAVSDTEPVPEGEPEFRINDEDRPPIRMLDDLPSLKSGSAPVSKSGKSPVTLRSALGSSIGAMLTEARTLARYSIEEVHQLTQIKSTYIEDLEKDRFDSLPNRVFLRAYIHALIEVYRLDAASAALIEEQMSELTPVADVPEKIVENIGKEGQINEAEAKRVKMIFIYGAVILLLLISLTVTSIISVRVRNQRIRARRQQTEQKFDSGKIEPLLAPQLPPPRMLEVPADDGKQQK